VSIGLMIAAAVMDFPDPLSPGIPPIPPGSIAKLMSFSTLTSRPRDRKLTQRPCISIRLMRAPRAVPAASAVPAR